MQFPDFSKVRFKHPDSRLSSTYYVSDYNKRMALCMNDATFRDNRKAISVNVLYNITDDNQIIEPGKLVRYLHTTDQLFKVIRIIDGTANCLLLKNSVKDFEKEAIWIGVDKLHNRNAPLKPIELWNYVNEINFDKHPISDPPPIKVVIDLKDDMHYLETIENWFPESELTRIIE